MEAMHTERLENGLCLEFFDHSNRYFGNFHRLLIKVRCLVPLDEAIFAADENPRQALAEARKALGGEAVYNRELTRMGVPGEEVEAVRRQLIEKFMESGRTYLGSPVFPQRFVRQALNRQSRPGRILPFSS